MDAGLIIREGGVLLKRKSDSFLFVRKSPEFNPNPNGIGSARSNRGARSVAAGYRHTFVITGDGKVWACGENSDGELGTGSTSSDKTYFTEVLTGHIVTKIVGGEFYTLFTDTAGALWGVGSADEGQLGLDDPLNTPAYYTTPQKIADPSGGSAWDGYKVTLFTASLDLNHSFFISNSSLWGMGSNDSGVLGISQDDDDDDIYTTYRNVGNNGNDRAAHPIKVFETSKPYAIGASATVTVPVVSGGTPATLEDVPSDNVTNFDDSAGAYNLSVKITGSNKGSLGYLGGGANPDGTADVAFTGTASGTGTVTVTINQYIRTTATSLDGDVGLVSSSEGHTIFTSADGKSAWSCGTNNYGECGTGSQVAGDHEGDPVGSGPNQHSEADTSADGSPTCFQPVIVVLPSMVGRTIIQVATGDDHTLILMSDGSLWGVGDNRTGQLGVPNPVNGVDGWVVEGSTNEVHTPVQIISSGVSFIAAAGDSSLALKNDGTLLGWGRNSRSTSAVGGGQLGNARYITDVTVSTDTPNYPIVLSTYPIPHDLLDGSQPYIRDCMNQADQKRLSSTAPGDRLRPITGIDPYSFSLDGAYIEAGNDTTCQAWGFADSPCTEPLSEFPANRTTIDEPYARVYLSSSNTNYACRYPQVIPIEGIAWNTKTPYGDNAPAVDEGSTAGFMPPTGSNNRVPVESPAPIATSSKHSIFITTLEEDRRDRPSANRDYVWSMGEDDEGRLGQVSPDSAAVAGVYNASNVGNPYNFPYYGQSYNDAGGLRLDFPNQVWISLNGI